jgi:hypothetical protein
MQIAREAAQGAAHVLFRETDAAGGLSFCQDRAVRDYIGAPSRREHHPG